MKFSIASYSAFPGVPDPILWVKIGSRVLDRQEITGPMDLEYQVQLEDTIIGKKGLGIALTPRVEIAYGVKGFANEDRSKPQDLPDGAGLFRPVWDKKKLRTPEQQPRPFVVLKQVELEPRYVAAWPPARWNVDLGEIGFGDDDGDLDDFIRLRIETGHLKVDPHHPAIGRLRRGVTRIITHTDTLGEIGARTRWT